MADDDRNKSGPLNAQASQAIRLYREAQRLPYTELAERLAEIGRPIPVLGLRRIERGERRVDVDDLAAIAKVLRVPPVLLLFPLGQQPTMEVLPGQVVDTWRALGWFVGDAPFTGPETVHPDGTRSYELADSDMDGWNRGGGIVEMFRHHHRDALKVAGAHLNTATLRRRAERATSDVEREELLREALNSDRAARNAERSLRILRDSIRRQGATPPELHVSLAHIDEMPNDGTWSVGYPTTSTFLGQQGAEDADH